VRIDWSKPWPSQHRKSLTASYARAPYFKQYLPLLESFYDRRDECISEFTIATTVALARELGIRDTRFIRSSELEGIGGVKTSRLIEILRQVGADHYITGPSARDYIAADEFAAAGIDLEYMTYEYPEYPQLYPPYDPQVSVLDLLFMTGPHALDYIAGNVSPQP